MTSAPAPATSTASSRLPDPRTAIVTGAGGPAGIGRVTAQLVAENGWHVALIDINADGLAGVEKELRDAGHSGLLALPTDIASEPSVAGAYEQIDSELPPVVGLVNLAGIACPVPLHECSLEEFERVMAVNVTGSFLMLKAAAARMIPKGVGRVCNTSSITAFDGGGPFSKGVYATAKAAVIGMCKGGARELGPYGITVNVIAPGPIDTEIMGGRLTEERKASMSAGIPLGRGGQPKESAAAVASFLPKVAATSTEQTFRSTAASTCTKHRRPELRQAQHTHPSSKEISMAGTVALSPERRFELSETTNRRVFKRLIPFLLLMYVIAFLDRSNVSFAQEEFEADFGISAASYAFGAGLFFVGYAIFEVPSNLLLHRVGARWWLSRIMVTWGIVAAAFMFVQGPISFYILRFLLGVMEAGFFPGVILFLTYWVPARHLSRARGYFYMGIALAGILGNPLSGGLLELNG